jgi:hypothetical protein
MNDIQYNISFGKVGHLMMASWGRNTVYYEKVSKCKDQ